MAGSRPGTGKIRMTLEYLILSEGKEVLKRIRDIGKGSQKPMME